MGAALKKLWNRIFEFGSSPVELSEAKFKSAAAAISSLEESYKTILAQLNKSEDDMIAYIESRSVYNKPLEEAYRLYKMSKSARSIEQSRSL